MERLTPDSLADLIARRRKIRWRCEVCRTHGDVDLTKVHAAMGDDFTFTNRRPRCRLCPGRVLFFDHTSMWPRRLDTIDEKHDGWWAYNDAERTRLEALGWSIYMGEWIRPGQKNPPPPG